jgi:hypothetical protein
VSPQFVVFNSMFAYQTLALPLALAAVALIARARWVADPRLLLGGATICLLAVTVTHHVTGLLNAGFLIVWAIAQRGGQARRRVLYGAVVAAVAMTVWAAFQWLLLREYFGPIVQDVRIQFTGGSPRRAPFTDSAGSVTTPPWERVCLVYYAAVVALVALWLMLAWVRAIQRRKRLPAPRCNLQRWEPRGLLVLMAVMIPLGLAAHILPRGGEIFDRSSSFLFLPFSLLVADGADRWLRSRSAQRSRPRPRHQVVLCGSLTLVLAAGVFVGGYLMGSGPYWARLPGSYLVVADFRSMDAETLAAVRWTRDGLPAGSRIAADRVGSALLANEAGLWPVMQEGELNVPSLYYADEWGPTQTDHASRLHLRYLYVDQRWADGLPRYSPSPAVGYFYEGETPERRQLTRAQLTKFDNVSGIEAVYRHGPIAIYDLGGLGMPRWWRSGWLGETRSMDLPTQLVIGLLIGLTVGLLGRSHRRTTVTNVLRSFKTAAGPSLTFAAAVAALCAASVTMLSANIWLEPTIFAAMGLAVLSINPHWARWALRALPNRTARLHWRRIAASAVVGLVLAVPIARSALDAYAVDVKGVQSVLEDSSAVHVPTRWFVVSCCGT